MSGPETKLPWRWVAVAGGWDGVADADGREICKLVFNEPENAGLIARAVNSHAALVEALREVHAVMACTCKFEWYVGRDPPCLTCRTGAALKLAGEGT